MYNYFFCISQLFAALCQSLSVKYIHVCGRKVTKSRKVQGL